MKPWVISRITFEHMHPPAVRWGRRLGYYRLIVVVAVRADVHRRIATGCERTGYSLRESLSCCSDWLRLAWSKL